MLPAVYDHFISLQRKYGDTFFALNTKMTFFNLTGTHLLKFYFDLFLQCRGRKTKTQKERDSQECQSTHVVRDGHFAQ